MDDEVKTKVFSDMDINFAARCLLSMSRSKESDNLHKPLDLSDKKSKIGTLIFTERALPVIVENVKTVNSLPNLEEVESKQDHTIEPQANSFMVARILTDLTSIKQEPVPNVIFEEDLNVFNGKKGVHSVYVKQLNQKYFRKSVLNVRNRISVVNGNSLSGFAKKTHRCMYSGCNKMYGKSSHLKAHLRTHTDSSSKLVLLLLYQSARNKVAHVMIIHPFNWITNWYEGNVWKSLERHQLLFDPDPLAMLSPCYQSMKKS